MDLVWRVGLSAIAFCTLVATLRLTIYGDVRRPTNPVIWAVTRNEWCIFLFFLLPIYAGQFGRGETSALPWAALAMETGRHGWVSGVLQATCVFIVDLWLFWTPAHIYVRSHPTLDTRTKWLSRGLNLSVGLVLVTPGNPINWLIDGRSP